MDSEDDRSGVDEELDEQSERVEISQNEIKKVRSNTRRWITKTWKVVMTGTLPDVFHKPEITFENVSMMNAKLMSCDDLLPDDNKCEEYINKVAAIVDRLKKDEFERKREECELELLKLRLDKERASIKTEKAKASAKLSPKPTINSMRLDIKIPPFDGSPCHYRKFEELFEAIVESNPSYDNASKFLYFTSSIGNLAHKFAPNLSPTIENLKIVKERLREHFENPGRVREHVRKTFEKLPYVRQLSQTNLLHELIVAWEEGVLSLRKSGTSEEQINNTYIRLMTSHLPVVILEKCNYELDWTYDELNTALKSYHKRQVALSEVANEVTSSPNREFKARTHMHLQKTESPKRSLQNRRSSPIRSSPKVCAICNGSHFTIHCNSYDVRKRREIAETKKLCTRCLFPGHNSLDCRSKYKCPCGEPHSRVLCSRMANNIVNQQSSFPSSTDYRTPSTSFNNDPNQTKPKEIATSTGSTSVNVSDVTLKESHINLAESELRYSRPHAIVSYYQTVVVNVNNQKVRVLIDGGCGRSSILESCAKRLNLPTFAQQELRVGGLGGSNTVTSQSLVAAKLNSVVSNHEKSVVLSVLPTFGKFSPASIPNRLYGELKNQGYLVSDTPDYHEKPIEIILGLEYVGQIWLEQEQMITEDICIRQSIFGWTAFGVTFTDVDQNKTTTALISFLHANYESRCLESTPVAELTVEEQQYLDEFVEKKVKIEDERIHVQLPWLSPTNLGTNKSQALSRFNKLVDSLRTKGRFEQYSTAMNEMVSKFAERAPLVPESSKVFYLPHHCVIRLDKSTTPQRIVFDGSAAEPGYDSLNNNLFKGVNSWNTLDLFTSFRFGQYVCVADIEKAFLQIKVDSKDRDALRFWWFDENGKTVDYRFTSVPFGTSASPFLLYASMHKLFQQVTNGTESPDIINVANFIKNRFYVDDFIAAFQSATPEQINAIKTATVSMFAQVSMNVRKWRTNLKEVDREWAPDASSKITLLGYSYDTESDTISLNVDIPPHITYSVVTKRLFSSLLARIYDPMGFVLPYVVHLRLFLRKLWTQGLDWDEPVPDELREEALTSIRDAHLVNKVRLKRNVLPVDGREATLLIYCDASKHAIGAVAYSLIDDQVLLLSSRSRLVKISSAKNDEKKENQKKKKDNESKDEDSIAKLELDALVLGSELAKYVNNLQVRSFSPDSLESRSSPPFQKVVICGDSLLNLQRLVKHPNDQRSSIALRVNKIAKLVPKAEYRHVVSKENPADIISRGCTMTDLLTDKKWITPSPPSQFTRFNNEIRTTIAVLMPTTNATSLCKCSRFKSYGGAIHAWRFIAHGLRRVLSEDRKKLPSIALGKILLVKYLQRRHFGPEIEAFTKKEPIDRDSVLRSYDCFLDEDGILRLRTRLQSGANLTIDQVRPIILPEKCHIVELIIQFEHQRLGHPGSDRTIYAVRDQFFPLGLRRYVRKLISQCMMCKRLRGQPGKVSFGSVPKFRYDFQSAPFTNVGIDIFGPLKIAMTTKGKRYGVIFSCATTRAVHIEPIHDQKAQSVFQALLNFMSRRGVPHRIYTDNGVNLMAVKKQLMKFLQQISNFHPELSLHVEWIQLTVSSPWRGGFYERLIRIIKDTLNALTFGKTIDNDALATALYQIEARINSRPLFVSEGQAITPAHFFAKRPLTQLPQIGSKCYAVCDKPQLVQYYKVMQSHVNAVWNAWYSQYLLTLRSFHQNMYEPNPSDGLRVGDAVILKNSTTSDKWPFGVVVDVVKSPDGRIRTVHVRTHDKGNLTTKARDIRTLIPFECTREIHEEEDAAKSVEPVAPDILTP